MSSLSKIKNLLNQHNGYNEGTAFPFWYVAVKGGLLRRPVMISAGIWFSRTAAEEHLKAKAHRYPKTAFVYCDSAHDSPTGLRGLFDLVNHVDPDTVPGHQREDYQYFLGLFADAVGASGSPTMDEVLQKARDLRELAEMIAGQDYRGNKPPGMQEAETVLRGGRRS